MTTPHPTPLLQAGEGEGANHPVTPLPAADTGQPTLLLTLTAALIGIFAFLQVYSVQAILPLLLRDLHASVVQVGATVGATVLGVALMSPCMGVVSDAVGRKPLIVGSVAFMGMPTALIYFANDIAMLTALRFLQGVAVPGITVVTIAYISEEFRGRGVTRMMSMYVAGTVLGGFLGRFVLGHLTEYMPWRHVYLLMGGVNLAGSVLVAAALPVSRHFVANTRIAHSVQTLASHLRNRSLLAACALGFCVLFTLVGGFTYVNLYLAAAPYHFSPAQLGNLFAVYLLGVVITPLAGRAIPALGYQRSILLAMLMSLTGALLTLLPAAWMIIVALAVLSSGVFIAQSATISFIATRVQTGRSLASGLYYMAYYSGGFVGAWLCGWAYTHGGWPATVAALVAAQLLGMWIVAKGLPGSAAMRTT